MLLKPDQQVWFQLLVQLALSGPLIQAAQVLPIVVKAELG